jgi:alkylresorcinol/alkylpyrone synthase
VPSRARRTGTRIAGLTTSDSPEVLSQREVLDRLGLAGDEFAERVFARCGVDNRHLELSDDFLSLTLQGRTAQIEMQLLDHSIRAIDALDLDPREVGTVISSSLYSLGCPTLAHRLVDHYEMDPATDKYHITGVGCASAVPLMKLASQAMREHPDRPALVVAAESMSGILMSATDDDPRAKTVGSAIFGDGCAAALLSADADADGPLILDSQVHQIAGTLGAVELECSDGDSHLHLARELPDLAGAGLGDVVDRFLQRNRLRRAQIDHWIVHPGGRRIVENVEAALGLGGEQTELSWRVLSEHGNVGTPSIMYVLRDTMQQRDPAPGQRGLAVTVGPGVTVGLMLLGW